MEAHLLLPLSNLKHDMTWYDESSFQNLMRGGGGGGGVSQYIGGSMGALKRCWKLPVEEFICEYSCRL